MVNQQLLDWIKVQQGAGQGTKQIYAQLIQQGYRPDQATEALNSINGGPKQGFTMPRLPVSAGVLCAGLFFFSLTISGIFMLFTGGPSEEPFDLTSLSVNIPAVKQSIQEPTFESLEPEITRAPAVAEPEPPSEGFFEEEPDDSFGGEEEAFDENGEDTSLTDATVDDTSTTDDTDTFDDTTTTDFADDTTTDDATTDDTFADDTTTDDTFADDTTTDDTFTDDTTDTTTDDSFADDTTTDDTTTDDTADTTTDDSFADDTTTDDATTDDNIITGDLGPDVAQDVEPIPEGANILASGIFVQQAYPGTGEAIVFEDSGAITLRLKDFQTSEGPDLRVYLSSDLTIENGVEIGPVQGIDGETYDYPLDPNTIDESKNNVLIWDAPFEALFTSATLSLK